MKKRIISIALTCMLLISENPLQVFAADSLQPVPAKASRFAESACSIMNGIGLKVANESNRVKGVLSDISLDVRNNVKAISMV